VSRYPELEPTLTTTTDDGAVTELHDVTAGRNLALLEPMCALHCSSFPEHRFAAEGIRRDALLPSKRNGIIVHQWALLLNGNLIAYSLADTNLVRRTAPIHFLAVDPTERLRSMHGKRLGTWFLHDSLRQYAHDAGEPGLGACAETPDYKLPIFLPHGWRVLPVTYLEPIHGDTWREHGLDTREVALIWLPPDGLDATDIEHIEPTVIEPCAASFLIDMYRVDPATPWVAMLCGKEAERSGPVR